MHKTKKRLKIVQHVAVVYFAHKPEDTGCYIIAIVHTVLMDTDHEVYYIGITGSAITVARSP